MCVTKSPVLRADYDDAPVITAITPLALLFFFRPTMTREGRFHAELLSSSRCNNTSRDKACGGSSYRSASKQGSRAAVPLWLAGLISSIKRSIRAMDEVLRFDCGARPPHYTAQKSRNAPLHSGAHDSAAPPPGSAGKLRAPPSAGAREPGHFPAIRTV